jgi:transcriptional regulator with XRE-family HTH domain
VDLNQLSCELVRKLRGARLSQQALSRRLGYGTNVVYLWERGRRFPAAGAFLALAQTRRVAVAAKLREFLGVSSWRGLTRGSTPLSPVVIAPLLVELAAGRSVTELAQLSGYDRNTISRWLTGKSQPRLPELLRFVGVTTLRLVDFVALFVDPSALATTRKAHDELRVQRELAYASPWSNAVLHALELDAYREGGRAGAAWLAERLGVDAALVEDNLHALERAGQIQRHTDKYRPAQVLSVDTRSDFEHNLRLKGFWADEARRRLSTHRKDGAALFSFNLFAISEADLQRLRQLHVEHYERVRQLVASARSADRVVLLNLQLVPLDEV